MIYETAKNPDWMFGEGLERQGRAKRGQTAKHPNGQTSKLRASRAFTIVELLVVVAIVGILLGIVTSAVTGSIKNARVKRADTMGRALEQAIAAYNAQMGKWPEPIETKTRNMGDKATYTFTGTEADRIFREIVKNSVGAHASRPLVDASALFVADSMRLRNGGDGCYDNHGSRQLNSFCGNKGCINGVDFSLASRKGSKSAIAIDSMAFGWQGVQHGCFCRYWVTYDAKTDSVKVSRGRPKIDYPDDWR